MNFWDFTYEPKVIITDVITEQTTVRSIGDTTTVSIQTQDVQVATNWGDIGRMGITLLLTYSVCLVVSKLVTVWQKGR